MFVSAVSLALQTTLMTWLWMVTRTVENIGEEECHHAASLGALIAFRSITIAWLSLVMWRVGNIGKQECRISASLGA